MRGHIRKRGTTWAFVVDVGVHEDGRRKQKWHSGFATRKEAQRALAEALGTIDNGMYVEPTKLTLTDYLRGEWLPAIEGTVRATTFDSYRRTVELHVIPHLGSLRLRQLSAPHLNALYGQLQREGRINAPDEGLSARSVRYTHTILHRALKDAVRWGRLARNVADDADPPKQQRTEMSVWSAEQLRSFLGQVKGDRLEALYTLAITTGLRRGDSSGCGGPTSTSTRRGSPYANPS